MKVTFVGSTMQSVVTLISTILVLFDTVMSSLVDDFSGNTRHTKNVVNVFACRSLHNKFIYRSKMYEMNNLTFKPIHAFK